MRTIVIGDIHGAAKALEQVLERCRFDPTRDQLICLGDYVDGWGDNFEVIDRLVTLREFCTNDPIYIMGNHDEWFLYWLKTGSHPANWMQGAWSTAESYAKHTDREVQIIPRFGGYQVNLTLHDIPFSHRDFFYGLHYYYITEDNRAFVHGGYASGLGQDHHSTYLWDRDLWERVALPGKNSKDMPKLLQQYKEVYIGHTTTMIWGKDKPMNAWNVWNMDTGAGYKGRLTAMDIHSKDIWQSDPVQELYPNQKGR